MSSLLRYLAAGVIAYLLFVVVTLPAGYVTPKLQAKVPGLALTGVTGTVFSGHAARAAWQDIDLGRLEWRFRPSALFRLRLEYAFEFAAAVNRGAGTAGIGPGLAYANDLDLQLESPPLVNHFSPMPLQTSGVFDLQLDELSHDGESVLAVTGTIAWENAAVTSPASLSLGNLGMDVAKQGDNIVASFTRGGALGLSGDIALEPGRRYAIDLALQPGPDVPVDTISMIETIAQQRPDGSMGIRQAGEY